MIHNLVKIISLLSLVGLNSACSNVQVNADDPRFAPVLPDYSAPQKNTNGSLFMNAQSLSLFEDVKAHQVGDIITVRLAEITKATKVAQTHLKKQDQMTIPDPTILGTSAAFKLFKKAPLKKTEDLSLASNVNTQNQFKGEADSSQNNSLTGDITVTVAQILPNRNLVIRGEKWITLNQGSEFIRLTGIVRPQDIGPDNSIQSARIADARISYSGKGALNETNNIGWLGRFFNSPLMPI